MPALLTDMGLIIAERFIDGIAIDPLNPPNPYCDHHRRSDDEVVLWYLRPYIVTEPLGWQVICLDMKRSDRLSLYEMTEELDDAVFMAQEPIPTKRAHPNPYYGEEHGGSRS